MHLSTIILIFILIKKNNRPFKPNINTFKRCVHFSVRVHFFIKKNDSTGLPAFKLFIYNIFTSNMSLFATKFFCIITDCPFLSGPVSLNMVFCICFNIFIIDIPLYNHLSLIEIKRLNNFI